MGVELLIGERHILDARAFVEIVIWHLPRSARGSGHRYKYRLALIVSGVDNEAGKGGHRHVRDQEELQLH